MMVVGVASQAEGGKNTLCDELQKLMGEPWRQRAFAYNVKKIFADTFQVSQEFIEEWKVKKEIPPGFDMPIRQCLQFIGDGFRKMQGKIWLDLAFRDKSHPIFISDVRYINEFVRIHEEKGFNILIGRPDKLNDDTNASEAEIKPYIEWCLKNLNPDKKVFPLYHWYITQEMPKHMDKFHLFIRNDGSRDEFLENAKLVQNEIQNFYNIT